MRTNGEVIGPKCDPYQVETESSGLRAVRLATHGAYVEFAVTAPANALVVRYSLPDAPQGGGLDGTLTLSVNGRVLRTLAVTSHYAHLYGDYPFTNDPRAGKHRNFYDEVRVRDVPLAAGDVVRLTRASGPECVVDLVDLENVPPPLAAPAHALSVRDFGAAGDGQADDTAAVRRCLAAAVERHVAVWVPPGEYKLTGDIIVPTGGTIQGAGMWYTTFVGDAALYRDANRRVRFMLSGEHVNVADFAIVGCLDYRNDSEPNDGIIGSECTDARVERIWIEHTKVGAWIYNGVRLKIEGCRFRDLLADGVNLCVGTAETLVENCAARGTGDDCFAVWPAPADQSHIERQRPGGNVIRHCTGQLPFLANGGCLYGGAGNRIEACRFVDITAGCGILISTTFPTADNAGKADNNFSGETVVENCDLLRCGGYDHDWAWRGAVQLCLDRRRISGVTIRHVNIRDSLSDAFAIAAPGSAHGQGTLTQSRVDDVTITGVGLSGSNHHAVFIRSDARGELTWGPAVPTDVKNDSPDFVLRAGGN